MRAAGGAGPASRDRRASASTSTGSAARRCSSCRSRQFLERPDLDLGVLPVLGQRELDAAVGRQRERRADRPEAFARGRRGVHAPRGRLLPRPALHAGERLPGADGLSSVRASRRAGDDGRWRALADGWDGRGSTSSPRMRSGSGTTGIWASTRFPSSRRILLPCPTSRRSSRRRVSASLRAIRLYADVVASEIATRARLGPDASRCDDGLGQQRPPPGGGADRPRSDSRGASRRWLSHCVGRARRNRRGSSSSSSTHGTSGPRAPTSSRTSVSVTVL